MSILADHGPFALLLAFVIAHALADFPLQGQYMATRKCRHTSSGNAEWIAALGFHGCIHAGGVWIVSGSWTLGILELCLHVAIDCLKCAGRIGFGADQSLHLGCKLIYTILLANSLWPWP